MDIKKTLIVGTIFWVGWTVLEIRHLARVARDDKIIKKQEEYIESLETVCTIQDEAINDARFWYIMHDNDML